MAHVTAFTGYYDTGGCETHGSIVVTAGVVSSVAEWEAFDARWLRTLKKYDVSSFHMVQIAHWDERSDIAGWPLVGGKRDEERRRNLLWELAAAAAHLVHRVFVRAVVLSDYKAADARYCLTEAVGGPYAMAQALCLLNSQTWLRERNTPPEHHAWGAFVERGDSGQDAFRRFCEKYLAYVPTFVDKKTQAGEEITPLSLADLVAYEHHHLYTRTAIAKAEGRQGPPPGQWRGILKVLRNSLPVEAKIVEANYLEYVCRELNLPLRRPA